MNRRFLAAISVVVAVPLASLAASAAPGAGSASPAPPPAPSASASSASSDALDRAKDLFRKGNELMKAGDLEAALDYFLRSRAVVPSVPNTMNAAISLDRLDRADEAIEMYEKLLTDFAGKLEEDDKKAVSSAMAGLRKRVGTVDVSANVDGDLVIDGRKRASVPLTNPIAVRPGKHLVRVLKDGYAPAEAEVTVAIGQNVAVDLKLTALAASGRLAVTEATGRTDVDVSIDGAPVGATPWQGTLAPGRHLVALVSKDVGTAPSASTVIVGQTVQLSLRALPLGPPLRLEPDPATAALDLDGVSLGQGPWSGRLPLGKHRVDATEEGYFAAHQDVDGASKGSVAVHLTVDGAHPRWRKAEESHVRVEAFGGLAFGSSLGGTAESSCPGGCSSHSSPHGFLAGARGAYVLPNRLRIELSAGYLNVSTSLDRTLPGSAGATYTFHDDISLAGPFVTLGAGYGVPLGDLVELTGRLGVGAFFAKTRDPITGSVGRAGESSVAVGVDQAGTSVRAVDVFALPELGASLRFGHLHVGATLGVGIFLVDGPKLPQGDATVLANCQPSTMPNVKPPLSCLSGSSVVASESPYQRFLLWMPQLHAGWTF